MQNSIMALNGTIIFTWDMLMGGGMKKSRTLLGNHGGSRMVCSTSATRRNCKMVAGYRRLIGSSSSGGKKKRDIIEYAANKNDKITAVNNNNIMFRERRLSGARRKNITTRRSTNASVTQNNAHALNALTQKCTRAASSSSSAEAAAASEGGEKTQVVEILPDSGASTPPPTARQLMIHAIRSSVPMIGFGFMDNTIMIHAGHYVDCTLGVTFGLSTLAAAGIGQVFSGIGGVIFGDALEVAFRRMNGRVGRAAGNNGETTSAAMIGTTTTMTKVQKRMRISRITALLGGILGVTLGCTLGLINLLFVDEHKASLLKLNALQEGQEFEFEVEVNNDIHPGYTTVVVRGPDVDGVLASITASIASVGCSVVELHAGIRIRRSSTNGGRMDDNSEKGTSSMANMITGAQSTLDRVEDTFLIRDRMTHQAIDNEDLDQLARTILAAAKDPLNSHSLKSQVEELQIENMALADRVLILEGMLEDRQVKIVPSSSSSLSDVATDDEKTRK